MRESASDLILRGSLPRAEGRCGCRDGRMAALVDAVVDRVSRAQQARLKSRLGSCLFYWSRGQLIDKLGFREEKWIWISFSPAWISFSLAWNSFSLGLDFLQPGLEFVPCGLGGPTPAPPFGAAA